MNEYLIFGIWVYLVIGWAVIRSYLTWKYGKEHPMTAGWWLMLPLWIVIGETFAHTGSTCRPTDYDRNGMRIELDDQRRII